jgi:hypothetical protein
MLDRHGHLLLLPRTIGSVGGGDGVVLSVADLELASPEQRRKIMRLARRLRERGREREREGGREGERE